MPARAESYTRPETGKARGVFGAIHPPAPNISPTTTEEVATNTMKKPSPLLERVRNKGFTDEDARVVIGEVAVWLREIPWPNAASALDKELQRPSQEDYDRG